MADGSLSSGVAFADVAVGLVAANVDAAVGDGVLDSAAVFVRVRAVGELAVVFVGANVAEVAGNFFGYDIQS